MSRLKEHKRIRNPNLALKQMSSLRVNDDIPSRARFKFWNLFKNISQKKSPWHASPPFLFCASGTSFVPGIFHDLWYFLRIEYWRDERCRLPIDDFEKLMVVTRCFRNYLARQFRAEAYVILVARGAPFPCCNNQSIWTTLRLNSTWTSHTYNVRWNSMNKVQVHFSAPCNPHKIEKLDSTVVKTSQTVRSFIRKAPRRTKTQVDSFHSSVEERFIYSMIGIGHVRSVMISQRHESTCDTSML